MVVSSRGRFGQFGAYAAALVVASMPAAGLVAARPVQPGVQATQTATGTTAVHAGQRQAAVPSIKSLAGRPDVDPDVMHHWYP